jgi:transcriptional regulator with XRE-family HTH domain
MRNILKQEVEKLGQKIRKAREDRKLTTLELGERSDMSAQQVRRIEAGETDASAVKIARIARALDAALGDLLSHIQSTEERANELWEKNKLSERLAGSRAADFKAKKAILEAMGLWEE